MDKVYSSILSSLPDSIDFDFITVKTETVKHIYLDNISEQNILFNIENAEGFIFEPTSGIIPKNKKLDIHIKIKPNLANVLVSNARIILEQKYSKIIKLSFVSKYPYLNLNKSFVEFGMVQIGKTAEEELIISNLESVPAHFSIERKSTQPGKQPNIFFISNLTGDIPPKSNYLLKILYKPLFPSNNSHEVFCLSTKGGNKITFACKGSCKPLKTWVGTKCVNFNTVPLGGQMKKLFRIYNDSDLPTEFQIYHDNSGAFSFDITEGIIPAKSNIRINATFKPYETIIYYQRVFCIIKNHMLFPIDLFGSCHNLLIKTPLIDFTQIEMFRYKELKGIFFNKNGNNNKLEMFDKLNKTFSINSETENIEDIKRANDINSKQPQLHKEMFWETFSPTRLISFDTDLIDFNYMQVGSVSEPYILKVNNNSNEDMNVKFIFEKPINLNNLIQTINIFHSENTVFFTQPEEQIIPKQSSVEFKVYFKPNKKEYYFYENLPCQATIINQATSFTSINQKNRLLNINKNKLSDFGKIMINKKPNIKNTLFNENNKKSTLLKSYTVFANNNESKNFENLGSSPKTKKYLSLISKVEPPISLYISMVGHSFPPGTQIFMPMFEFSPKKEIFFPPTSINQSLYQTLKIENKNDTPLFYKINPDPQNIFRVHNKYGLIASNSFHLICLEFSPKDTTVYRFPLHIIFNHDSLNTKTIMLNGLCTDPVIEIEGIKDEIYFAPCYVGIKTKRKIVIKNLSPIRIKVNIKIDNMINGILEVDEDNFEMELNSIKYVEFGLIPNKNEEISAHILITAERIYDPSIENIGIYNPENFENKKEQLNFDRRIFKREINVLGRGSNGDLSIKPEKLEFGTVKVGFHKKLSFSIYNPTITNFYIRLIPDYSGNISLPDDKGNNYQNKKRSDINIDFIEGLLNSFCKKDINIQFEPKTRVNLSFKINIYATDTIDDNKKLVLKKDKSININKESIKNANKEKKEEDDNFYNEKSEEIISHKEELKCSLEVNAKGDYPLIKIVDLRNNNISPSKLWKDFNVDIANQELQKKLTEEEMDYSNAKSNKKISEITQKFKIIQFNFGKKFISKNKQEAHNEDVFLTLKNEGGVLSEFYFNFPDDVNIKREIWMDPVEPTSNDKVEYHVLKEHIFTIEPRKSKLGPGESCNIRLRYCIKEKGIHRLRVLFQVVNGKPLIFELYGETLIDKNGILSFPKDILDFYEVPIGNMDYITSSFEIKNISNIKVKYIIDKEKINKYNENHKGFEIFKIDNYESTIGPGESKYLIVYFRPLADIEYKLDLTLYYTDEVNSSQMKITIKGKGYNPLIKKALDYKTSFEKMPNSVVYRYYNNQMIQKCGISLEDLDFGLINKPKNKTFIIYNFSEDKSFNFDFTEPGFLITDELQIIPNKGTVEPKKHKIIKCILSPKEGENNEYEGDILIKIIWNPKIKLLNNNANILPGSMNLGKIEFKKRKSNLDTYGSFSKNNLMNLGGMNISKIEKENLYLRVSKKSELLKEKKVLNNNFNLDCNSCFVELIITKLTQEILTSKDFIEFLQKNMDYQPLSLYKWTHNDICSTLPEIRKKFLKHLRMKIINLYGDLSQVSTGGYKRTTIRSEIRAMTHRGYTIKSSKSEVDVIKEKYDEENDNKLEEKYIKEVADKYKYSTKEMNEKIIIVNDETKKLIIDTVMENTIFNIICEAVYGEIDLTEKQRIYFFLDKNTNSNINENDKINNLEENKEISENKKNEITNKLKEKGNVFKFDEEEK